GEQQAEGADKEHTRKTRSGTSGPDHAYFGGPQLVPGQAGLPRIHGARLDRKFRAVNVLGGELVLHLPGAKADYLDRALRERVLERFHAGLRVRLHVAFGGTAPAHHQVRLRVEVHEARIGVEVAMLGGIAAHAGADGDDAIGFLEQLHRGTRTVGPGDAGVIFVFGEPAL